VGHRITGIDTPFGGISWEKTTSPKDRVAFLFRFLESKRLLTNPIAMEIIEECASSAIEIKNTFVSITDGIDFPKGDLAMLSKMANTCNTFLDSLTQINKQKSRPHILYKDGDHWEDKDFDSAMKLFRNGIKQGIAYFEKKYKLNFVGYIPDRPF